MRRHMVKQGQRSLLGVLLSDSPQSPCLSSRLPLNSRSPGLFCLCRNVGLHNFESCFNEASWTFLLPSSLRRAASTERCKHTLDAHLPQNYSLLSFPKLLHRDSRFGVWSRVEGTPRGEGEKSNLDCSLVNLQTFFQGAYMR